MPINNWNKLHEACLEFKKHTSDHPALSPSAAPLGTHASVLILQEQYKEDAKPLC